MRDENRTEVIVQIRLNFYFWKYRKLSLSKHFQRFLLDKTLFYLFPYWLILQEANAKVAYELDQTVIEFASALENLEFSRAIDFLERRDDNFDDALWRQLASVSLIILFDSQ